MQVNAQTPNRGQTDAKSLLNDATQFLESRNSIQSDISYVANLLGHKINGKGNYAELRIKRTPYIRMELKIPLEDKMGALVKVCDGRYLWTYRKVLDHENLEQVDMDRVYEALEKKYGHRPNNGRPILSGLPSATTFPSVGAGGLADILKQLADHFDFNPTTTEAQLDRMPIVQLEGTWNRKNLLRLLPKQRKEIEQGKKPDLSKLPPHIPDRVIISLGAQNPFPYRIEYLRTDADSSAGQGRGTPLMTIYLHNVRFDPPISETYFDYLPGDLEPLDKTAEYIQKL